MYVCKIGFFFGKVLVLFEKSTKILGNLLELKGKSFAYVNLSIMVENRLFIRVDLGLGGYPCARRLFIWLRMCTSLNCC